MLPFQVLHQKNYKSDLQSDSWEIILNNVQSRILHNPLGIVFVSSHLTFFTNGITRLKTPYVIINKKQHNSMQFARIMYILWYLLLAPSDWYQRNTK